MWSLRGRPFSRQDKKAQLCTKPGQKNKLLPPGLRALQLLIYLDSSLLQDQTAAQPSWWPVEYSLLDLHLPDMTLMDVTTGCDTNAVHFEALVGELKLPLCWLLLGFIPPLLEDLVALFMGYLKDHSNAYICRWRLVKNYTKRTRMKAYHSVKYEQLYQCEGNSLYVLERSTLLS